MGARWRRGPASRPILQAHQMARGPDVGLETASGTSPWVIGWSRWAVSANVCEMEEEGSDRVLMNTTVTGGCHSGGLIPVPNCTGRAPFITHRFIVFLQMEGLCRPHIKQVYGNVFPMECTHYFLSVCPPWQAPAAFPAFSRTSYLVW